MKDISEKKCPQELKYRHKHNPKIHVWGGISKRGDTHLVMYQGIMTATKYGDILFASLIPFTLVATDSTALFTWTA